jgi:hypothetical protein
MPPAKHIRNYKNISPHGEKKKELQLPGAYIHADLPQMPIKR